MSKQEEIREGIFNIIHPMTGSFAPEHHPNVIAYKLVKYLHSEGVVIQVDRELPWRFETCKCCTREQRVAWSVPDALWGAVVIDYYKPKVLCLECFMRMADDREVIIDKGSVVIQGFITQGMEAGYVVAVEPLIKGE